MEMVRQSIAVATRQKHLRTLLGLTRMLRKDWTETTKDDIEKIAYEIMQNYSDPSGKSCNPHFQSQGQRFSDFSYR